MKRNDIILLSGILILSALLFGLFRLTRAPEAGAYVVVSVKGAEHGRYTLSENRVLEIEGPLGTNRLVIEDGNVRMEEAVCPDHYCIEQGAISKTGEQIICLPNGIIVEIIGGEETGLDAVVS
ncbi:MAG: NusG domain II-containing protein [Lachnospiraceae bacterium]|nr:NusG domain II-containing protein [Lachnospiraceae bacterium]